MKYLIDSSGRTEGITLAPKPLGKGGEAYIYEVRNLRDCLAKIYREPDKHPARREKIEMMMLRPPKHLSKSVGVRKLPLVAWPTHLVLHDDNSLAGFLMPRVPDDFVPLERCLLRRASANAVGSRPGLSENDRSLPSRLSGCRNLASLVADLHLQGHFVVDMKPQNIWVQRQSMIVCMLDCDGFSIAAKKGKSYRANAVTPDYLAPEHQSPPEQKDAQQTVIRIIDDTQDRFALAALIFQWLNNIHPFQGAPKHDREPQAHKDNIRDGLYPYGLDVHPEILPAPNSTHDCLPEPLRLMFDRAFASAIPGDRPTAVEWRDCLERLKTGMALQPCTVRPDNVLHIHFAGQDCPECRYDKLNAARRERPPAAAVSEQVSSPPVSEGTTPAGPNRHRVLVAAVLAAAALAAVAWHQGWLEWLLILISLS